MKYYCQQHYRQKGLTLIEVLIASMILFMAIGLAASVFQQNILLQRKVLNQLEQNQLLQVVTRNVLFHLEQNVLSGQETIKDIDVVWRAKIEDKAPFIDSYSFDTDKYSTDQGYVIVYSVTLTSVKWPDWSKTYKESIWTP